MNVTYMPQNPSPVSPEPCPEDPMSELFSWFSVSGDTDDFIYYNEPQRNSEK